MPVDHSKHGFLKDIGTDWVALGPNGAPLARAHDEESVRRAAPDAASYVTSVSGEVVAVETRTAPTARQASTEEPEAIEPEAEQPEPVDTVEPEQPESVAEEPAVEPDPAPAEPAPAEPAPAEPAVAEPAVATGRRKRKPAE